MSTSKWLIFFGLVWSAFTLLGDGWILMPAVRQVSTLRFEVTDGKIIASKMTTTEGVGGDSDTYGVKVSYSYAVGDRAFVGHRYCFNTYTSSDLDWAQRVVVDLPPGARVKVYYDPTNPENSVLQRGIVGSDLFLAMSLTPFNVGMLGFWWVGWAALRRKGLRPPAGGVKLKSELRQTRARLTQYSPLDVAIMAGGLLAFLGIFVVLIGVGGSHPSLPVMTVAWAVILAGATAAGLWHWAKIRSGKYDLIFDEMNGSLQLPLTCGRKTRQSIPLAKVQAVYVATVEKRDSEGRSRFIYVPTVRFGEDEGATAQLVQWCDWRGNAEKASEFVEWLNEKLPLRKSNFLHSNGPAAN